MYKYYNLWYVQNLEEGIPNFFLMSTFVCNNYIMCKLKYNQWKVNE